MMELGLRGKGALATTSSGGLGKAIALEPCREGVRVILFSPFEEQLREAQAEITKETGSQPEFLTSSITNVQDTENLVQTIVEKCGPTSALVNNMGGPKSGVFDAFSDQDWQDTYKLCLLSHIRTTRAALLSMRQNGGGRILCSTSSSVEAMPGNLILPNTFRMGVMGLARMLSQELGKGHTLVSMIGPGRIDTDRIDQFDVVRAQKQGIIVEEVRQQTCQTIPMGRYGKPEEYGKLAAFLCSEANTFTTGQTVLVDGGMTKAF